MARTAAASISFVLLFAGCAIGARSDMSSPILRTAVDVPERFSFPNAGSSAEGCTSPAVDPRTGEEHRFVRSAERIGDFEVPAGRYGVAAGELIRLDCATGAALGIVRR